jgi:hypothetical protein
MIVIVIMGVIYTLVITKLNHYNASQQGWSLETLKPNMTQMAQEAGARIKLFCFENCDECSLYIKGKKVKDSISLFEARPEVYSYDYLNGIQEKRLDVFFDADGVERDVCFSFGVNEEGVSDQVIVLYKDKVYDYTNYFTAVDRYDSLDKLVDAKTKTIEKVK